MIINGSNHEMGVTAMSPINKSSKDPGTSNTSDTSDCKLPIICNNDLNLLD